MGEAAVQLAKSDSTAGAELPAAYLLDRLEDAERLLFYAVEAGIEVEAEVSAAVIRAKGHGGGLDQAAAANLLSALSRLAARVRPVTAEGLRASADPSQSRAVVRSYTRVAIGLSAFIIPFSLLTFISSAMSDAVRKDTDTANALAVKLSDEVGPAQPDAPPGAGRAGTSTLARGVSDKDVIKDLQQFAALIRSIDARARQLNFFTAYSVPDPFARWRGNREELKSRLELPPSLPNLFDASTEKIGVFQDVRYFAQTIQETVATSFGAIATCVLPVLYALLGACAYLLRSFEQQIKNRTFTIADGHVARFLMATIGGLVVGLFNNFNITQGGTLPPLAVAFLVGYAADVFFSFLEGFLHAFNRARPAPPTAAPGGKD